MTNKTQSTPVAAQESLYRWATEKNIGRKEYEYRGAVILACNEYEALKAQNAELVDALSALHGWVERVLVTTYSDRKPMPENLRVALELASVALAKVGAA